MPCTKFLSIVLILVCLTTVDGLNAFSYISATVKDLLGTASAAIEKVKCPFSECCGPQWIINNITGLQADLQSKLYGQHLVVNTVYSHITAHVKPQWQPRKALALSFHGWMGTGKNYVAKIIAENLYKNGMKSKFVHLLSATREFPHSDRVKEYKDKIRKMIETNVKKCPQSLFIFDEMEKVPAGLIDAIRPYLQPYETLAGVDYRRAIFLFLGNIGGDVIARYTLRHLREGKQREDIQLADIESLMEESSLHAEGGLSNSELILNQLITASIPFLPLNTTHVRQCIEDTIVEKNLFERGKIPQALVDEILDNMHFQPENEKIFSTSGCKRVAEKVDLVVFSGY